MQLFKTGDAIDDFPKPSAPAMNLKSPSKWQVLRLLPIQGTLCDYFTALGQQSSHIFSPPVVQIISLCDSAHAH